VQIRFLNLQPLKDLPIKKASSNVDGAFLYLGERQLFTDISDYLFTYINRYRQWYLPCDSHLT